MWALISGEAAWFSIHEMKSILREEQIGILKGNYMFMSQGTEKDIENVYRHSS